MRSVALERTRHTQTCGHVAGCSLSKHGRRGRFPPHPRSGRHAFRYRSSLAARDSDQSFWRTAKSEPRMAIFPGHRHRSHRYTVQATEVGNNELDYMMPERPESSNDPAASYEQRVESFELRAESSGLRVKSFACARRLEPRTTRLSCARQAVSHGFQRLGEWL